MRQNGRGQGEEANVACLTNDLLEDRPLRTSPNQGQDERVLCCLSILDQSFAATGCMSRNDFAP